MKTKNAIMPGDSVEAPIRRTFGWRPRVARLAAGAACAAITAAALSQSPVLAAEQPAKAGIVVAAQATAQATADRPGGISVFDHGGQRVVIKAKGQQERALVRPSSQPVTFSGLTLGKTYTVQVGTEVLGTVVPVTTPGEASRLVVATTEQAGQVALTWKQAAKANTGALTYRVTATAAGVPTLSAPLANGGLMSGLDVDARYTFTVTPYSSAGAGKPATATMAKSLRELGGVVDTPKVPVPTSDPQQEGDAGTPNSPSTPSTPSSPQNPTPGPTQPRIRIIMVCPEGYVDAGSTCTKTTPYTYSTMSYTYHPYTRTWTERVIDAAVPMGDTWQPGCADGWCVTAWHDETHSETIMVKDAAPAGYSDSGSGWSKKNPVPAGYTDDGTQWVTTTAKVAKEVPA